MVISLIKYIVDGLLEKYKTNNPYELCDCLEIKVIFHPLGNKMNGFLQRTYDGYEIIHINDCLDENLRRYTCAHELGHAIMQPDLSISFFFNNPLLNKNKAEIEADKFAAELLINNNEIDFDIVENFSIEQLSSYLKLPQKLVKYKFHSE